MYLRRRLGTFFLLHLANNKTPRKWNQTPIFSVLVWRHISAIFIRYCVIYKHRNFNFQFRFLRMKHAPDEWMGNTQISHLGSVSRDCEIIFNERQVDNSTYQYIPAHWSHSTLLPRSYSETVQKNGKSKCFHLYTTAQASMAVRRVTSRVHWGTRGVILIYRCD